MLQVIKRKKYSKIIIAILSMCIAFGLFLAPKQQSKNVSAATPTLEISIDGSILTVTKTGVLTASVGVYKEESGKPPKRFLDFTLSQENTIQFDLTNYNDEFDYNVTYTISASASSTQSNQVTYVNERPVVPLPADPAKEGHTFVGWYYDDAFTLPYDNAPIYEDTTLYAKFEINTFTVTWISDGQTLKTDVLDWNTVAIEATLSKVGSTFLGWFTDQGCTQAYAFSSPVKSNITLYAKWESNMVNVTFMVDGAVYNTLEIAYGTILTNDVNAANYVAAMGDLYTDMEKKTDLIPPQ